MKTKTIIQALQAISRTEERLYMGKQYFIVRADHIQPRGFIPFSEARPFLDIIKKQNPEAIELSNQVRILIRSMKWN